MNKLLFFLCIASISVHLAQAMDNSDSLTSSSEDIFNDLAPLNSLESKPVAPLSDLESLQSIANIPAQYFNLQVQQAGQQNPEINTPASQLPLMPFLVSEIKERVALKRKLSTEEHTDKSPSQDLGASNSLNNNEQLQPRKKPFECKTCKKVFTELGNLKTHQVIHTGAKPFPCQLCGRAFRRRHHLQMHEASAKCGFWTDLELL